MKRFVVEVYRPGSDEEVWETLESDTPLMLPRVGEIIVPVNWQDGKPGDEVEVTKVSHAMWRSANNEVKQKTLIYTRASPTRS
jgi:hypothetical protein